MRLKVGGRKMALSLSLRGLRSCRRSLGVLSLCVSSNRSSRNKAGGMWMFAPAEAKRPHYDSCTRLTVEAEAIKDLIAAVCTPV